MGVGVKVAPHLLLFITFAASKQDAKGVKVPLVTVRMPSGCDYNSCAKKNVVFLVKIESDSYRAVKRGRHSELPGKASPNPQG